MAVITLTIDSVLLSPPVVKKRQQRRDAEILEVRLLSRSDKLEHFQSTANANRKAIAEAFDVLDSTLNLASRPNGTGLPEAKATFLQAEPLVREARLALTHLPASDSVIMREASAGRQDIARLLALNRNESNVRYLKALDEALLLLIETQKEYAKLGVELGSGFKLYEMLFERTAEFLNKAGTYRNAKEASQVYVLATSDLIGPLVKLRNDLDEIETRAAPSAELTTRAFRKAAALRPER